MARPDFDMNVGLGGNRSRHLSGLRIIPLGRRPLVHALGDGERIAVAKRVTDADGKPKVEMGPDGKPKVEMGPDGKPIAASVKLRSGAEIPVFVHDPLKTISTGNRNVTVLDVKRKTNSGAPKVDFPFGDK
jgi:hypothetical protein